MKITKADGNIEIEESRYRSREGPWLASRRVRFLRRLAHASNTCVDFEHVSGYEYDKPKS